MPAGVPTATFAIGGSGAANAALFALRILALSDAGLARALEKHRKAGAKQVLDANARMKKR
jgi:5-(carboxyamino)imidazole ribonucleotide mutase